MSIYPFLIYLLIINAIGVSACTYDKTASVLGQWRVPENTYILLAALGSAFSIYLTFKAIRHKTRHKRLIRRVLSFGVLHMLLIILLIVLPAIF